VANAHLLITGATGFIGGRLAAHYLDHGYKVRIAGRNPGNARHLIDRGADFSAGDLTDPAYAEALVEGADTVIHCAGKAGTWGPYAEFFDANVKATDYLLQASQAAGVTRFINLSSPSIYFDFRDQFDLTESVLPARFSNAYAQTKFEAEALVSKAHRPAFATVSLRPRLVIGAGDTHVLPRLIAMGKAGMLTRFGKKDHLVSVTSIENLIHAVDLCLKAQEDALGGVYNIANPEPVKFWEMVARVLKATGVDAKPRSVPRAPVMLAARCNELICKFLHRKSEPRLLPVPVGVLSYSMTLSISKAQQELGYDPPATLDEAITGFSHWWLAARSE